jgi:hypothetical protein
VDGRFSFLNGGSIKKRQEFVQQGNDLCCLLMEIAVKQPGLKLRAGGVPAV